VDGRYYEIQARVSNYMIIIAGGVAVVEVAHIVQVLMTTALMITDAARCKHNSISTQQCSVILLFFSVCHLSYVKYTSRI
jgi:hypothetical protein